MSVQVNPTVEKQPLAYIDQPDPTLDKYYPVVTMALGEIYALSLEQTNDETDVKDIEILVTIDGTEYSGRIAAGVSGTRYFAYRSPVADALILTTTFVNAGYYVAIRGHVVTVEASIHTANGTNEILECDVQYGEAPAGTTWWWKHYPTAINTVSPPTIDTYYTIAEDLEDARIIFIAAKRYDDDAGNKEVRMGITLEGTLTLDDQIEGDNSWEYWYLGTLVATGGGSFNSTTSLVNATYYDTLDCQDMSLLQVRQENEAIGANAVLIGTCVYELYEEVA